MQDDSEPRARQLFFSGFGVAAFCAFVSAGVQIHGLVGSEGLFPVQLSFEELAAQGVSFWDQPSLLWLSPSDTMLSCLVAFGAFASVALIFWRHVIVRVVALATIYTAYLSLVSGGENFFAYQWDSLLLEAALCALPFALSNARWARLPLIVLNARLLFASAIVKLGGPTWQDGSALDHHFWTQPLPGPLSFVAHQLPGHALMGYSVLLIEFAAPLMLIFRRTRRLAVLLLIALQLVISATGNFGFFGLLSIVLCVPAMDERWLRRIAARQRIVMRRLRLPRRARKKAALASDSRRHVAFAIAALLLTLQLVPLTGTLIGWRSMPDVLARVHVALMPLRAANGYGLFARMTTSRVELIFEGTLDGETWQRYEFAAKPGAWDELPRQSAPHLPRLDWGLWFAALGHPHHEPLVHALRFRLQEANPETLALLRHDPFSGLRPLEVRMRAVPIRFTSWSEWRRSGDYWKLDEGALGEDDEQ